mmetsp:Transcript_29110/g.66900  ORF Transcript_29110/g.66900 Transcript_29110/m.66900 type:complete len:112 (-) Transcript_29110:383-718(-)
MVLKHSDAQPMAEHKVLMQALKRAPRSAPWCRTALSLSWMVILCGLFCLVVKLRRIAHEHPASRYVFICRRELAVLLCPVLVAAQCDLLTQCLMDDGLACEGHIVSSKSHF